MKKIVLFVLLISAISLEAQVTNAVNPVKDSGWFFSLRGGYDIIPMYDNNTPYIDYKGGLELGTSIDYYWKWYGLGFDFDYIKNKPKSTYPTENVYLPPIGGMVTKWDLQEQGITRMFFGIGPSFKYNTDKFMAELNLRAGYGLINGGQVALTEKDSGSDYILNYHAGYKTGAISSKTQVRFTYFFNNNWGAHIGAYYMNHYKVKESANKAGIASSYYPFNEFEHGSTTYYELENEPKQRKPCNCKISSIGVFAGVTYKFTPTVKAKKVAKKECDVCAKYALAVTAKDRFTQQVLPNTDVVLKNMKGEVIKSGTTNNFGVVVFDEIKPDNYMIEGVLYETALTPENVKKNEFIKNETLQKKIWYSDENFILKGNVVQCNTTIPVKDVKVVLKNKQAGIQKSTLTDENGDFVFHLKQKANFEIYGKKQKYFSQTEQISTGDFDRNKTLFIKLEVCMDKADCGSAIRLNNIHYDLDKYFIRDDAKPELDKLVEFMKENPMVHVEVSSHTDSRGSDAYNLQLSQNRAKSAVMYVVSKGISSSRISGVGYGETRLLNRCSNGVKCSEAEHQVNRRTEMKVVCP